MNVFFTAATTNDGEFLHLEQKILDSIFRLGHTITSGAQIVNPKLLASDARLTPEQIFTREKKRIDQSDCVIAEVTKPSSGVGGELVYALMHGKPVLALAYKDSDYKLSPMIAGNPSANLYRQHYALDNVRTILSKFFRQVAIMHERKGKLIVIDGGDGSGKTTQSELLTQYLTKHGYRVKHMDFPRYYSSFHGQIVGRFLSGEFGQLEQVSPYLASLAYALDRAAAKDEMDDWLSQGGIIVSNRYATSSMAHQTARVTSKDRAKFISWLDELEYKEHKIPREDIVIYLYVPWEVGMKLTMKKGVRKYVKGSQDIMERDTHHRQEAQNVYLDLAKKRKNWVVIDCMKGKKLLSPSQIHKKILSVLVQKAILPRTPRLPSIPGINRSKDIS